MIQDLSDKVWHNPRFQEASNRMELAWLAKEVGGDVGEAIVADDAARLVSAAAILACSKEESHRRAAYRIATYVYEFFGTEVLPFNQALRVVLARLGNFPAFSTRADVSEALEYLPLMLATEDLAFAGDDLSPKFHPVESRIRSSFGPVWPGVATAWGAKPVVERSAPGCCGTEALRAA